MLLAFLIGVCINVYQEMNGNPRIEEMGIVQESGAMEGKEIRSIRGYSSVERRYDSYVKWVRQRDA